MRHFAHHIGDYAAATAHLSFIEDAAYHRLLRRYYQDEKPLPADLAATQRLVGARSRDEREAVKNVLEEFFTLGADGWHQVRADKEIDVYHAKADAARENGTKGGRPANRKRTKTVIPPVQSGKLTTNHSPDSEAKASGADAPPVDMTKLAFDAGVSVMTASGMTESNARSLVGKWRKAHGDEAVFKVLGDCQRQSITEPASWIEAALKAGAKPTRKPWEKAPIDGLPPTEDWPARMRGYRPGVIWWKTNVWGPEPGQPGCRVPPSVLAEWQQQVAA